MFFVKMKLIFFFELFLFENLQKVLAEYKSRGNEFLFQVFESAKYLEDLTGISDLLDVDNDIIDFNDSDFELSE